ncbi:hypothetical protein M427DRAFT_380203 [Gonapodya prolifera JEL478]|uniref:Uncharacterized protein n=1 Tax=Gonapodya prolifera (strain JEL478) TaxID=1344416 RepID=A0A139AW10_GONPJ|nr:hypothetical protein M427DRAFT_380203 [Gonapodya prolifera JEL478]|eukprot:KXS20655.1 hypothetical protein M427DRAFT_380203 [Gonapodya prolifera JEL478]
MSAQLAAAHARLQHLHNTRVAEDERELSRQREEEKRRKELAALLQDLPSTLQIPGGRIRESKERSQSPGASDRAANGSKRKGEDTGSSGRSEDGIEGREKKRKVMSFAELMATAKQTTPDELRVVVEDHSAKGMRPVRSGSPTDNAHGQKRRKSRSPSPRKASPRPGGQTSHSYVKSVIPPGRVTSGNISHRLTLSSSTSSRPTGISNSSLLRPPSHALKPTSPARRPVSPVLANSRHRTHSSTSSQRSKTPTSRSAFYLAADLAAPVVAAPRDLRSVGEVLEDKRRAKLAESSGTESKSSPAPTNRLGGSFTAESRPKRSSPEPSRPSKLEPSGRSSADSSSAIRPPAAVAGKPPPSTRPSVPQTSAPSKVRPVAPPSVRPPSLQSSTHSGGRPNPPSSSAAVPEWRKLLDAVTGGYRSKFQGKEEPEDDSAMVASRADIDREERRSRIIAKREDEIEEERERREKEAKLKAKREREKSVK